MLELVLKCGLVLVLVMQCLGWMLVLVMHFLGWMLVLVLVMQCGLDAGASDALGWMLVLVVWCLGWVVVPAMQSSLNTGAEAMRQV